MIVPNLPDLGLPGLAIVMDERRFLAALASAIRTKDPSAHVPCSMHTVRLRHRPSQRAVLHVEFGLEPRTTEKLAASIWLFAGSKAQKRAVESTGSRVIHEPLTNALVYFFPTDPYVPQIEAFAENPETYAASLSINGFDQIDLCRFRPGIGATFCCKREDRQFAYVKIQKDRSARQSAEALFRLGKASFGKSFAVPVPAGVDNSINAYSMLAVDGVGFAEVVAGSSLEQVRTATHRLLHALTDFHAVELTSDVIVDRDRLVSQCWDSASAIEALVPDCQPDASSLAARIERCQVRLAATACHGDMKPEHAILSTSCVTLLDLDCFAIGDPLYDLAMLDVRIAVLAAAKHLSKDRAAFVGSMIAEAACAEGDLEAWRRFCWLKACAALQLGKHHSQKLDHADRSLAGVALRLGQQSIERLNGQPVLATHPDQNVELEKLPCG